MEASAKFVLDASPALIRDHNQALINYFFERLPEAIGSRVRAGLAARVFGCIEVGSRGDTESLYQTLRDERFVVALREGKIRVAPHLLNSTQDIDRLLVVMAKARRKQGMSPIDERLKSLNIVLPDVMPPVVDGYVPAFAPLTRSGDQIHLSGRLGKEGGKLLCGKVGEEISLDQGKLAARHVAIELLAVLKAAIANLAAFEES